MGVVPSLVGLDNASRLPPPSSGGKWFLAQGILAKLRLFLVSRAGNFVITVLLPWSAFTLTVCLFAFAYAEFSQLVWALVATNIMLALTFIMSGVTTGRPSQLGLGFMVLAAVGVAVPIGIYVESTSMSEFWRLDNGASYTQVGVVDPGSIRSDAVFLEFNAAAFVDVQRTVGYMKRGVVYCVAPIVSHTHFTTPVYWVVGEDCCGMRENFECGSVYDQNARSGIVLPSDTTANYHAAMRMATSVYDLQLPASPPMFLHWTADTQTHKRSHYLRAATDVAIAAVVHLACSFVAGIIFLGSAGAGEVLFSSRMPSKEFVS